MEKISFQQFSNKYSVIKNPIKQYSNYENTLLDIDDEELEELEETNPKKVWTLKEDKDGELLLIPGMVYKDAIGYFMCKNEWNNIKDYYSLI